MSMRSVCNRAYRQGGMKACTTKCLVGSIAKVFFPYQVAKSKAVLISNPQATCEICGGMFIKNSNSQKVCAKCRTVINQEKEIHKLQNKIAKQLKDEADQKAKQDRDRERQAAKYEAYRVKEHDSDLKNMKQYRKSVIVAVKNVRKYIKEEPLRKEEHEAYIEESIRSYNEILATKEYLTEDEKVVLRLTMEETV